MGFNALLGSLLHLLCRTSHLATKRLLKYLLLRLLVSLPIHNTIYTRVLSYRLFWCRDQLVKLTPNLTLWGN